MNNLQYGKSFDVIFTLNSEGNANDQIKLISVQFFDGID